MKILNINSYYYSSSVHNQLQNILNKHDINTYTYVPVYKGYIPRDECKFDNEENVYKSECFNRYDKFIFYLKHSKIFNDIKKHVKISDYSCLHAHSLFSNGYIAYKLYKKYHIPYVVTVRNTDINVFFKKAFFLRNLGRKIINNASQVIFLSNAYRDMLINQYVKVNKRQEVLNKSIVIPSGINDFWLDNKGTSKTYDKADELKLLYVGVINKNKNLYTTVKAIDVLVSKGMKVKYTVVGKISDEQAFNEIKDRPFVNYLPPRNKEELLNIYRENHLFVMPSVVETFGLVYPEALSQGLPIIYTRGQGFDGQIAGGLVGYSVDCFDVFEIADKIIDIVENYVEFSKNALKYSELFSWNKIVNDYKLVYGGSCDENTISSK